MKYLFAILISILFAQVAMAQSAAGMTYHGRLLKPNGQPVATNVQFKIQILSPGNEECVLWEETQSQDLTSTSGVFVLHLNGSQSTRIDGGTATFNEVFSNRSVITPPAGKCAVGYTNFDPTLLPAAPRLMRLSFNDGSFAGWEDTTDQAINYTPKAIDALQVSGFAAKNLLRFAESDGTLVNTSPLNNAQYTELLALLAGTSSKYMTTSGGASLPTSAPTTLAAGKIWLDGTELKYYDGASTQTLGTSVGSTQWSSGTGDISYSGKVGIGVTSPSAKLEVKGTTTDGSAAAIVATDSSGSTTFAVRNDGRVGIGTSFPSTTLGFGGEVARSIGVERASGGANGNDLTISSGGATPSSTDKKAGDLYLTTGLSTGVGNASIYFQTSSASASGNADRALGTRMQIDGFGNVGVGGNGTNSNARLYIANLRTNSVANSSAVLGQSILTQSATSLSSDTSGVLATLSPIVTPIAGNNTGALSALGATARVDSPTARGTVTNLSGVQSTYGISALATGSPTVTNAYGVRVVPVHDNGNITNSYGLRIDTPTTGGTVSNEWGVYVASPTASNVFAGKVGIGTSPPAWQLDVRNSTSVNQAHFSGTGNDDGLYLNSNGAASTNISAGTATANGTAWTAKATSASIAAQVNGTHNFFGNTGLTVGTTFTPTKTLSIIPFLGGSWLDLPTTGPSGIGTGGSGANPWLAYVASGSQYFAGTTAGDIVYRNANGKKILIGIDNGGGNASPTMAFSGSSVGIGVISPTQKLDVAGNIKSSGQITSGSQTITGGTSTVNWNNGNSISTDYNCASPITLDNLTDGGTYTLVITDAGTTQCSFATTTTGTGAGTVSYRFRPANGLRTASSHSIYTLMRVGSVVYVSWTSGF
jgi:trimeric autotransporter adhesin